jgi:diaminohydroxyphosphoribosylaminopyrimidine deaminase/5-amino-6-(5-phosphoribosylamino)uracil reductase
LPNSKNNFYIQECIRLSKEALGNTSPNPYVGSVIVKDDKVIARGFHKKSGTAHAELDAIQNATESLKGATLYCNLEPCCHTNKKTPPCTDRIIQEGITKVVIANLDVNPLVAGKGVEKLRSAGIEVIHGPLSELGNDLNEVFFTHITKSRPFIHLKWAQTLDGKIATNSSDSKWITGEKAREYAHRERALYDAIVIGANTLNKDNPSLTTRLGGDHKCSKRIVLSRELNLDSSANLFNDEFKEQTIIISAQEEKTEFHGVPVKYCPTIINGQFDLKSLMELLYKNGIYSIYIEGGMSLISSFIDAKLFDRISIYTAPKLLGPGIELSIKQKDKMGEAINFENGKWTPLAKDILFETKRNVCLQD